MGKVALVDRKYTLLSDSLEEAIKCSLVKITSLVVHPGHNRVCL